MAKTQKTYSEKLQDPRWQKKRLEILTRDNWTCTLCGDKETTLHVHHSIYQGEPWDCPDECLNTVCKTCHKVIESLPKGEIHMIAKKSVVGNVAQLYMTVIDDEANTYARLYEHDLLSDSVTCIALVTKDTIEFLSRLLNTTSNG
jgi:hypothetical protein